jgi:hypothetical protein
VLAEKNYDENSGDGNESLHFEKIGVFHKQSTREENENENEISKLTRNELP